jgi:LPS-assembly lipoprotein
MSLSRQQSGFASGLVLAAFALAACGFQLRTAPDIPAQMSRTYISADNRYSLFYRRLRDELASAGVQVVDSPVGSSAVFSIRADDTDQRVLSVSARNVPREYEVYYTINYSVESGDQMLVAPQSLTLTRDYTYDETLVLGKAREEELLREAIADDLVRIVLKQLSSL